MGPSNARQPQGGDARSDAATSDMLPVFWLCGAPGVGKSVTAWGLFEALSAEGVSVAHLDIDQLGMLYPDIDADDDADGHHLKAKALAALVPNYAAAGAEMLIVSGVVDPAAPADVSVSYPGLEVTFCLLTVDEDTIRERILARGCGQEDANEAVAENAALVGATFLSSVLDTSGRSVADVVEQVRQLVPLHAISRPVPAAPEIAHLPPSLVDLVLVYGPRAVGLSSVAFSLAMRRWKGGAVTGFVDLQQLAFVRVPGREGNTSTVLGIANVTAMHRLFAARGATRVIISAHLSSREDHDRLRRSVPATVTTVPLAADERTNESHIRERVEGNAARLAGDDLLGASAAHQAEVLGTSLAEQQNFKPRRPRTSSSTSLVVVSAMRSRTCKSVSLDTDRTPRRPAAAKRHR